MPISGSFRTAERNLEMEERKKERLVDKFPGKEADQSTDVWDLPEKRLRFVDFQRIEDNRYEEELSEYELAVKRKLGCVPSASDIMIREENEREDERKERNRMRKLRRLAEEARLSPRQRACYELLYVKRLAEEEIQAILGISQSRLCQLKDEIEHALLQARHRCLKPVPMGNALRWRKLTMRQKEIWKLRYRSHLTLERIAISLGIRRQTVHEILRAATKKIFP